MSLLEDIRECFVCSGTDRLFSRSIVIWLNQCKERPWGSGRNGESVTELWLSQRLKPLGIRPRTIRIDGEQAKGYDKREFSAVFKRFIPASEIEAMKEEWSGGNSE